MDQLEQNQSVLREEIFGMRAQMGKLMETIQVVARGQEAIARGHEELRQANERVVAVANPMQPPGNPTMQIPVGPHVGMP